MYYDAISLAGGGHACTCDVDPSCCDRPGGFGLGYSYNPQGQGFTKTQVGGMSVAGLALSLFILSKIFARP